MVYETQLGPTLTSPTNAGSVGVGDVLVVGQANAVEVVAMRFVPVAGRPGQVSKVDVTMERFDTPDEPFTCRVGANTALARVVGGNR